MTQILRQSTTVDVLIGPFLDLLDGSTAETGETPAVKLSKNGQTLAAKNDVTTPAHDADGYYNCEFSSIDTGTVGTLVLTVAASANALPVRHEYQVIEEAAYDALYAASANPKTGLTVSTLGSGVITAASIAADAITAAKVAADVTTEIQSGLATSAALATVDTVVDGIKAVTDLLPDAGALTSIAQASALATVDGNVDAILVDTGTTLPATLATIDGVVDAILLDTAEIGAAGAGLTEAGGTGDQLTALATAANLATIAGFLDTEIAAILEDTGTTLPALIAALNNLSASDVNAQVLDVLNVDTFSEPGQGAPSASPTIRLMLHYLYKSWRNKKTQTTSTFSLYADDGTTVDQKGTVSSDGTTATRGEVGTGA